MFYYVEYVILVGWYFDLSLLYYVFYWIMKKKIVIIDGKWNNDLWNNYL